MRLFVLCFSVFCFAVLSASFAHAQYPGFSDPGTPAAGGAGGSGGLVAVSPNIDGGEVPIGATAQVVVLFRNEGGQPVETGLIRLYPSSTVSAAITLDQCKEEVLSSGAECAVALSVKGLQPGPWRVEMLMSHSGRSRLVTSTLSGVVDTTEGDTGSLTSDIEMIPDELDFGSLSEAQTLVEPVILRNITSNSIDITDIYIDTSTQAGYKLKTECTKLAAGESCIATITWSPKLRGRSSGVLVAKHTGPAAISSVALRGQYDPDTVEEADVFPQAVPGKGLLVSSQTEVDFGTDITSASAITVSLVNVGDAPLALSEIRISGSDNGLGFRGEDGCSVGTVLEPVEACPMTVTWSPTRVGDLLDDIQILHDGARGVLVLPVRGAAEATVSQDQKAIVLSDFDVDPLDAGFLEGESDDSGFASDGDGASASQSSAQPAQRSFVTGGANLASVLDGYKITSFSASRAIINGPGGSRIVFANEESVIGGVPWMVLIQRNGIEFVHRDKRVLLLFDRSLSSINRVTASSDDTTGTSSTSTDTE